MAHWQAFGFAFLCWIDQQIIPHIFTIFQALECGPVTFKQAINDWVFNNDSFNDKTQNWRHKQIVEHAI